MPRGNVLPRRTSRRPRLRGRLRGISAFSAISAAGFDDRRQGTRHDLARRPPGKTGNSCAPLWRPGKGFPTFPPFPPFPPIIWPPTERVVQAADDAPAAALEAPMLMKVMPVPCRRRSADIRHNIAQDCQPRSSHGTCRTGASGAARAGYGSLSSAKHDGGCRTGGWHDFRPHKGRPGSKQSPRNAAGRLSRSGRHRKRHRQSSCCPDAKGERAGTLNCADYRPRGSGPNGVAPWYRPGVK
jgi:hypothetical protein